MTAMSTLRGGKETHAWNDYMLKYEKIWPPAIPYTPLPKKGKKPVKKANNNSAESDSDDKEVKYRSFEVKFDPSDKKSDGYTQKVAVFEDGHPEEWVKWRKEVKELFKVLGYGSKPAMQHKVYQSLLAGKALEYYNDYYSHNNLANLILPEARHVGEDIILQHMLNDVAKKIFPNWEITLWAQKAYMQKCLFMGNQNPEVFKDWLLEMNDALEYFPTRTDPGTGTVPSRKLEEEKLVVLSVSVMEQSCSVHCQIGRLTHFIEP